MTHFLQLHMLTSYPPANLNRDDLGRPKTALFGGVQRLRVSSQSLKRAWRKSELFEEALDGHVGERSRRFARNYTLKPMQDAGIATAKAEKRAKQLAAVFGKPDDSQAGDTKQLAHASPQEIAALKTLVATLIEEDRDPSKEELGLLRKDNRAADIALFGRMLADTPDYNTEAAAQVAHAISVHAVTIEDDYFTAVDDLNKGEEDSGAGMVGEAEFAAGLFYVYLCIDCDGLAENLQGDDELAEQTLRALVEAACKVAPGGKQNSYGSRAYASYVLAERGSQQPRSLSVAFLQPVQGGDYLTQATERLASQVEQFDRVYGETADQRHTLCVASEEGSFSDLLDFVGDAGKAGANA